MHEVDIDERLLSNSLEIKCEVGKLLNAAERERDLMARRVSPIHLCNTIEENLPFPENRQVLRFHLS